MRDLYPPERRVALPTRYTMCGGPALVAAFDYMADAMGNCRRAESALHHSPMMATIASSPSVSAAGPGCRISGDLISRSQPSRTAGIVSKPGRAATFAGTNFLPHQEPMNDIGRGLDHRTGA